jgi:glycosyltransferase involved in cell wall biosynthesis
MIVERFPPDIGGSGIRFYKIAKSLSKRHMIDIFTLGISNNTNFLLECDVYRFDSNKLFHTKHLSINRVFGLSIWSFLQLLHRSYDVLDIDLWPMLPFFSARLAKLRTPIIVTWNVVHPFSFHRVIRKISGHIAYLISRLSTYNITVSDFAKQVLVKNMKLEADKISVIRNGIEKSFLNKKVEPKWGRLVYVGRLEPQKRLDLLLSAFKILKKQVDEVELHIVGNGSLLKEMMITSRKLKGLTVHSIKAHKREELVRLLAKSWLFVSASEFETYGLAIAEASCLGLPVVLTRTPCNAACIEIIKHRYNGLIVEHDKPEIIAEAIKKLYWDQRLWQQLSYNAKQAEHFISWSEVAKKTEEIYKKVAEYGKSNMVMI